MDTRIDIITPSKRRKIRSLYKWISKTTGLSTCWIESKDTDGRPVWAIVKHLIRNIFVIKSRRIAGGVALITVMSTTPALAQFSFSDLNGTNGFTINGSEVGAVSGARTSVGDINGDGFDDVVVGAQFADPNGYESGELYVILGGSATFMATIEPSDLDGSNGFVIKGGEQGSYAGIDIQTGDINGDGIQDLHILATQTVEGGVIEFGYTIFGTTQGFPDCIELSNLEADTNIAAGSYGTSSGEVTPRRIVTGDFNGDGIIDVSFGSPDQSFGEANQAGGAHISFGSTDPFSSPLQISSLIGEVGFTISGKFAQEYAGFDMAAGDVNGDGFHDFIMGAPGAQPYGNIRSGETHVIFGCSDMPTCLSSQSNGSSFELGDIDGSNGFTINGVSAYDNSGQSVASGDINGDGYDDIIIGASFADPNYAGSAGTTYIVFGQSDSFNQLIQLSDLNGTNGFAVNGIESFDLSGRDLATGDINDDGIDDIIIGAPGANPNGMADAGQTYVIFGRSTGFPATIDLSALAPEDGFTLNGTSEYDASGSSVSSGDINGDGVDDVIVGAYFADPNGLNSAGQSYIFFGSANIQVSTEDENGIPTEAILSQNYPNPFNPTTTINYAIARPGEVRLEVFDLLGRKVSTLVNSNRVAGSYTVNFNASGLSSGVYIYRLQTSGIVLTRKFTLIK